MFVSPAGLKPPPLVTDGTGMCSFSPCKISAPPSAKAGLGAGTRCEPGQENQAPPPSAREKQGGLQRASGGCSEGRENATQKAELEGEGKERGKRGRKTRPRKREVGGDEGVKYTKPGKEMGGF